VFTHVPGSPVRFSSGPVSEVCFFVFTHQLRMDIIDFFTVSGSGGEGCEPALGGQRGQPSCATLWEMAAMR